MIFVALLLVNLPAPSAQNILSTKAGVIQYAQGALFVDNVPLSLSKGDYPQLENGQNLRTELGRAELLLAPGIYLRLGEKSVLRMEQNSLEDTQVELKLGSALIEAVHPIKENRVRIHFSNNIVEIKKAGLYRLDSSTGEARTYGGEISVLCGNRQLTVKRNRMAGLNGKLAAKSFH